MTDVYQTRRENLRTLIDEVGSQVALAEKVSCNAAYISQVLMKQPSRQLGSVVARKMEATCGKPMGWMDIPHSDLDPRDDAERDFIEMALTIYRRDPGITRQTMNQLLNKMLNEPKK